MSKLHDEINARSATRCVNGHSRGIVANALDERGHCRIGAPVTTCEFSVVPPDAQLVLADRGPDDLAFQSGSLSQLPDRHRIVRACYGAVRAIRRHAEGVINRQCPINHTAPILQNIRHIEVPPDRIAVVDHEADAPVCGQHVLETTEHLERRIQMVQHTRTVDVVEPP